MFEFLRSHDFVYDSFNKKKLRSTFNLVSLTLFIINFSRITIRDKLSSNKRVKNGPYL